MCVLSHDQDHWGVAYASFVLAKQAGFDLAFRWCEQPLPVAPLYLLPAVSGHRILARRRWQELLARVAAGAVLYLSLDSGLPSDFEPVTGLAPQTRERRREWGAVTLDGLPGAPELPACGTFKVRLAPTRATVLGRESDGSPALAVAPYGAGRVVYSNLPYEVWCTHTPGAFHAPDAPPVWRLYRYLADLLPPTRAVTKASAQVAVTEHPLPDGRRVAIAINHGPEPVARAVACASGWQLDQVRRGAADGSLPGNDAAVWVVRPT